MKSIYCGTVVALSVILATLDMGAKIWL